MSVECEVLQDAVLKICKVRNLDKTKFMQLEIYIAPFSNWKKEGFTLLHFRPFHVTADPDENVENGLKIMANIQYFFMPHRFLQE